MVHVYVTIVYIYNHMTHSRISFTVVLSIWRTRSGACLGGIGSNASHIYDTALCVERPLYVNRLDRVADAGLFPLNTTWCKRSPTINMVSVRSDSSSIAYGF